MRISFTKMQGLGNDFIVINGLGEKIPLTPQIIMRLADRRFGVGFDQLLLLEPSQEKDVDFHYRIFNADGSEVAQCGNGARCLARFIRAHGLSDKKKIRVATAQQHMELEISETGQVRVNMGLPRWQPAQIPFLAPEEKLTYTVDFNNSEIDFSVVNMGNPHCVLLTDDVSKAPVSHLGPYLSTHPLFPEGANVGFMQIRGRAHIALRVYERGAGETPACGSGACAAVVAGNRLQLLNNEVCVGMPGGCLTVSWAGTPEDPVWLAGPAETVFEGEIEIGNL